MILINTKCQSYNLKLAIVIHIIIFIIIGIILFKKYYNYKFTQLNENLIHREDILNSLCSTIDEVFIIFDIKKNEIQYVSPNMERILGILPIDFTRNPYILFNYINKETKEIILDFFKKNIHSPYETECQLYNPKTNELCWLLLRFYPLLEGSNVVRYICCVSDLTKEKQSHQILKDALLNAQKANDTKREFLSHMSHEIRTPIYTIIGMTEIATKSVDNQNKIKDCLNKVMISSKQLLALISDILDMSKIDSNKMILSKEPFHIKQFLKTLASFIYSQAEINQQEFDLILTDLKDEYLIGDTLRLNQILVNCISNSLKFTPSGGNICLEVCEIEKHANKALFRFTITDNGKGMSDSYIERIFIPFEQEDSSIAKKYGGSGLGMSITKNLVTLMGGNIHVRSKTGVGTIITIDIVFEINNEQITSEETINLEEEHYEYDLSNYRILVVEDNSINLEITCELLKITKIIVDIATDGKEAVNKFMASEPGYYNAILMDVQMPILNGYEAAKAIRKSAHIDANNICIIAMTANSVEEDISLSYESGMNYHITKPFDTNKLYALLKNILIVTTGKV